MNTIIKLIATAAFVVIAGACAPLTQPPLQPLAGPDTSAAGKIAKVNNFQIILDASLSMEEGGNHFVTARSIASRINQGIPTDLSYNGGLRTFGHSSFQSKNDTDLIYGMTRYDRQDFHNSLTQINYIGGSSPLTAALAAAGQDLKNAGGKSALVIISDGLDMHGAPAEAQQLKALLGSNLCIYTIAVGKERNGSGHKVLQKVADAGQCGFATTAVKLTDNAEMSKFISSVFLTEPAPAPAPVPAPVPVVRDTDGDGVPDHLDKCPGTPKGVTVDTQGCPVDSDGDGVPDYLDKCPATPFGVRVDAEGCPTVLTLRINFGFDSSTVGTDYNSELARAAACISNYPGHEVLIIGHTDSTGPEAYNQRLSEQRAAAVKKALAERFNVPASKMVVRGDGESRPVADNTTEAGRDMNRRVEVACGADVN